MAADAVDMRAEAVHALRCTFLQLRPPAEVLDALVAAGGGLGPAAQRLLLECCLCGPVSTMVPCGSEYKRRVLRAVVLAVEQSGADASEELMQEYSECLLAPAMCSPAGWGRKLWLYGPFTQPLAEAAPCLAMLEREAARRGHTCSDGRHGLLALNVSHNLLEGGTGCHEWEAGFFLAEFILSNPGLFAGAACLELGCGAGMVGVALHRAGARRVLCTDGDAGAVANCALNLRLNGLAPAGGGASASASGSREGMPSATHAAAEGGEQPAARQSAAAGGGGAAAVECRLLHWEEGPQGEAPDAVLGADLLYDPGATPPLLALIKQLLAAGGSGNQQCCGGDPHSECGVNSTSGGGGGTDTTCWRPAAYIATTRRNEATLQAFLDAVAADPQFALADITPAGVPPGSGSSAASAADNGGGKGSAGAPAAPAVAVDPAAAVGAGPVRFYHHPELEAARPRILLHRLQLAPG
eukprot:scaffold9.g3070.t1